MVENAPDSVPEEASHPSETKEDTLIAAEKEAFHCYVDGMKEIRRAIIQKARERCDMVRRGDIQIAKKIIAAEASLAMVLGKEEESNYLWRLLTKVEGANLRIKEAKQNLYEYKFGVQDILPKG